MLLYEVLQHCTKCEEQGRITDSVVALAGLVGGLFQDLKIICRKANIRFECICFNFNLVLCRTIVICAMLSCSRWSSVKDCLKDCE